MNPTRRTGLKAALGAALGAEAIEAKIRAAQKDGRLPQMAHNAQMQAALDTHIISSAEAAHFARFERLRAEVVKVDHFAQDFDRAALATAHRTGAANAITAASSASITAAHASAAVRAAA